MKKWMLGVTMTVTLLAACGDGTTDNKGNDVENQEKGETSEEGVSVDKGLLDVEINLPATFFEGQTEEEIIADATEDGAKDVKINADGSITYKLSKKEHKKLLSEMETSLIESIQEIVDSSDFPSIKEISFNKDFTEFDMKVDQATFENSFDSLAPFTLLLGSAYYHALSGKDDSEYKMEINYIDEVTGETFNKGVFPEEEGE